MEPTIQDYDIVIADKFSSTFRDDPYQRGDVIVTRSPLDPNNFICKRIAAKQGEVIRGDLFRKTVPKGHVWILGDNLDNSTDSRNFGSLPVGLIVGRVVCRVWPLDRLLVFKRGEN